jgi:hypothetical protein
MNTLHKKKRRETSTTGRILGKNSLPKHVIKGKKGGRIKVTGRRGRRRKQLMDNFKEKRRYCKLKDAALNRPVWRILFGRLY